jgi:hypothetical protein
LRNASCISYKKTIKVLCATAKVIPIKVRTCSLWKDLGIFEDCSVGWYVTLYKNYCPVNCASSVIVRLKIVEPSRWAGLALQIITGPYAEWFVLYNLLDCHFHTGFDDG